jgi:hypothetical protein
LAESLCTRYVHRFCIELILSHGGKHAGDDITKGASDALSILNKSRPLKKTVEALKPKTISSKTASKKEVKEFNDRLEFYEKSLSEFYTNMESFLKEKGELELLQSSRGTIVLLIFWLLLFIII